MKMRNITWNDVGTIDCEIEHPVHGWIPFTADPNDVESHGREAFSDCLKLPEIASQRPNNPRAYPIPPELKAEDMEVLEVVEGQVVLSEAKKAQMIAKREYDNLVTQAQGMLAGFSGLRENLGLQVEALVRNDSVVLNELRSKFEFAKYLEYRKEVSMSDGLVPILVRNNRDELEIKMVSFGTVPSGMIQVLPFGFGPDDLEFVSYKDGDLKLDLEGRLNKFKLVERDFETARARDEWNEKGIIERFSEAYLGRG
jgi:hypothetical protein